jgi:putative flippase GtrA
MRFIKVFAANGCMALISTALLFLMVDIMRISELIAPIINIGVVVPVSFLVNKYWAFK